MIKNSTEAIYNNFFKNKKYIIILIVIVFYLLIDSVKIGDNLLDFSFLYDLNLYFWGIFIQAFPFILSGALLSSIIQVFIGQDKLNVIGASGNSSSLYPLIAAFAMPTCDCSSVTIAAGFIKKNFPLKFVIIYLLAAPIINPIVIAATVFAFPGRIDFVIIRLVLGILTALIIANIMHRIYSGNTMSSYVQENYDEHESCAYGHCHDTRESGMTFF